MCASVEIIVAELHIPGAISLKDKRRVVKSLIDRSFRRLRVSVAETDHHDLRQRAELTFAIVLTSSGSVSEALRRHLEHDTAASIVHWDQEIVDLA